MPSINWPTASVLGVAFLVLGGLALYGAPQVGIAAAGGVSALLTALLPKMLGKAGDA